MLGEQEVIVLDVKPFGLHGVTYYDVTVRFPDGTVEQARLGPESVPDGLQPGERVMATRVANMIISRVLPRVRDLLRPGCGLLGPAADARCCVVEVAVPTLYQDPAQGAGIGIAKGLSAEA